MERIRRKLSTKQPAQLKESSQVRKQEEGGGGQAVTEQLGGEGAGGRGAGGGEVGRSSPEQPDSKEVVFKEEKRRVRRSQTLKESGSSKRRTKRGPVLVSAYCLICYGDYSQPKQLPCGHTFCLACIEKYVNPKLMVECPQCRQVSLVSHPN